MRLRKNFLSHTAANIGCLLLIFTFIPITFVFELAVVLPELHDTGGFFYIFTWVIGLFLLFNIKANMIACMVVDTSIQTEILQPPTDPTERELWHYCSDCETLAPPRSWHCKNCRTCILKRDHHCQFTGSCVGHKNHRYFLLFIAYCLIGSAYTTIYNSIYFWVLHPDIIFNLNIISKMTFPMLIFTLDTTWNNLYLLIYEMNIIAFVFSLLLMVYHVRILLRGAVTYECDMAPKFDLGWKRNLETVLGRRMHLVWLSPFLKSDLPHDGIHWETVTQQSLPHF